MRETKYTDDNGGESGNFLITPPLSGDRVGSTANERIQRGADVSRAIVVTVEQSVEEWLTANQDVRDFVDELVIVGVGDGVRSTTAVQSSSTTAPTPDAVPGEPVFEFVSDAGDLSTLGQTINTHLHGPERTYDGAQTVLYVDSIPALIEATDTETVFRFLHTLTSLVDTQGATAYYLLDPRQIDAQTTATLSVLFDTERVD